MDNRHQAVGYDGNAYLDANRILSRAPELLNLDMINYIRKMLEIDKERFYIYMEHVGNTVSSTIPIALSAAREEGKLHGNVMLAGFGVGLSWGAVMLKI